MAGMCELGVAQRCPVRYLRGLQSGRADQRLRCRRGHGPGALLSRTACRFCEKIESREGLTRRGKQVKMGVCRRNGGEKKDRNVTCGSRTDRAGRYTLFDNRNRDRRMCGAVSMTCSCSGLRREINLKFCDPCSVLSRPARESHQVSSIIGEFDPGSGRTLAACLTHASQGGPQGQPANGCVTREQSASMWGIAGPTAG